MFIRYFNTTRKNIINGKLPLSAVLRFFAA